MARTRDMIYTAKQGVYRLTPEGLTYPVYNGLQDSTIVSSGSKVITDVVSTSYPYPDHDLDIVTRRLRSPRVYGGRYVLDNGNVLEGYIRGWRLAPISLGSFPNPSYAINWLYYITKAQAVVNPSTPSVDLPLFLFELRELPRMIKDLGDILRKRPIGKRLEDIPNAHLAYSFGWSPLFGDLKKFLKLADLIAIKRKQLEAMNKKGGLRVSRKLGSTDFSESPLSMSATVAGQNACSGIMTYKGVEEGWCTARIFAGNNFPADLDTAAFNAVLGLNASAATIWNALPWTWLIDYFLNVGDILDSLRGYLPYRVENLNVMVKRQLVGTFSPDYIRPSCQLGNDGKAYEASYKGRRVPVVAVPMIAIKPWLTLGQIAILGSLVTRDILRARYQK